MIIGNNICISENFFRRCLQALVRKRVRACQLPDHRLHKRLSGILEQMGGSIGETIPRSCQDWEKTKAAYRFLSNERFSEHEILQGHFEATSARFKSSRGTILVFHDTTEFSFRSENPELIGYKRIASCGRDTYGRRLLRTACGILMHSSLVVPTNGLPLGLAAIKFWSRKKCESVCPFCERGGSPYAA